MKNNTLVLLLSLIQLSLGHIVVAAETDVAAEMVEAVNPELQPAPDVDQVETDITISRYNNEVLRLESESGAYNRELIEELVSLGRAYSNNGNHAESVKTYARALHISRVNDGLQNLDQLPVLELVIEENTALQDYAALTDNYAYMLWVYKRNYGDNDPQMLPVLERVANWHLEAYGHTEIPESLGHLVMAANLFSEALETITLNKGADDPDLIRPLYGIVHANFSLLEPFGSIEGIDMFMGSRSVPLLPSNFGSLTENNSMLRHRYIDQSLDRNDLSRILEEEKNSASLIQNSYRSGRSALEKIIDIHIKHPELSRESYAYALTHLGDWFQRFTKRDASARYYQQAYAVLTENAADEAVISAMFGRPTSLDALNVPEMLNKGMMRAFSSVDMSEKSEMDIEQITLHEMQDKSYVLAQFDVTATGSVRNIEFIGSNPEDNIRFRRMARDRISTTPFRPRLEAGKPIDTKSVKMMYTFEE